MTTSSAIEVAVPAARPATTVSSAAQKGKRVVTAEEAVLPPRKKVQPSRSRGLIISDDGSPIAHRPEVCPAKRPVDRVVPKTVEKAVADKVLSDQAGPKPSAATDTQKVALNRHPDMADVLSTLEKDKSMPAHPIKGSKFKDDAISLAELIQCGNMADVAGVRLVAHVAKVLEASSISRDMTTRAVSGFDRRLRYMSDCIVDLETRLDESEIRAGKAQSEKVLAEKEKMAKEEELQVATAEATTAKLAHEKAEKRVAFFQAARDKELNAARVAKEKELAELRVAKEKELAEALVVKEKELATVRASLEKELAEVRALRAEDLKALEKQKAEAEIHLKQGVAEFLASKEMATWFMDVMTDVRKFGATELGKGLGVKVEELPAALRDLIDEAAGDTANRKINDFGLDLTKLAP